MGYSILDAFVHIVSYIMSNNRMTANDKLQKIFTEAARPILRHYCNDCLKKLKYIIKYLRQESQD
jgi:hypothetical protein